MLHALFYAQRPRSTESSIGKHGHSAPEDKRAHSTGCRGPRICALGTASHTCTSVWLLSATLVCGQRSVQRLVAGAAGAAATARQSAAAERPGRVRWPAACQRSGVGPAAYDQSPYFFPGCVCQSRMVPSSEPLAETSPSGE